MKDIQNIEDIKIFVNEFYLSVRQDELLAPIFALRIEEEAWEEHLSRMYAFWNTVFFFGKGYKGNPFAKHIGLPLQNEHFDQWTSIFNQVIDANFRGNRAEEIKLRVSKMANLFKTKIQHGKDLSNYKPII